MNCESAVTAGRREGVRGSLAGSVNIISLHGVLKRSTITVYGLCYIVIQIHCTKGKADFRRSEAEARLREVWAGAPAVWFIYALGFAPQLIIPLVSRHKTL